MTSFIPFKTQEETFVQSFKTSIRHALILAPFALGTGTAGAQSSLTISGFLDTSVVSESGGATGSVRKVSSGVSGPSRLIFSGREDLGGGYRAFFHLEHGVLVDTGASPQPNFFGRQSFVGLGGDVGSLRLGNMLTPLFNTVLQVADPFTMGSVANAGNLLSGGAAAGPNANGIPAGPNSSGNAAFNAGGSATAGVSRANALSYTSPVMGGVQLDSIYALGEQTGGNSKLRTLGFSLGYTTGPLNVRFAYQDTNDNGATAAGVRSNKARLLAANYNFGVVRPYLAFGSNKGYGTVDNREYLVGVAVPLPVGLLRASYIKKDDASAANQDATQLGIGYVYPLSRRTNLHASWARIDNRNRATYTVNSPAGAGAGTRAFAVGIGHSF